MRITNILIVAVIACVLVAFGYAIGIDRERYAAPGKVTYTTYTDQPPWPKGDRAECGQILQDGRIVRWEEPGPMCHSVEGIQ